MWLQKGRKKTLGYNGRYFTDNSSPSFIYGLSWACSTCLAVSEAMINFIPIQSGIPNSGRQIHLHMEPEQINVCVCTCRAYFVRLLIWGKTTKRRIQKHPITSSKKKENPEILLLVNCYIPGLNTIKIHHSYTLIFMRNKYVIANQTPTVE